MWWYWQLSVARGLSFAGLCSVKLDLGRHCTEECQDEVDFEAEENQGSLGYTAPALSRAGIAQGSEQGRPKYFSSLSRSVLAAGSEGI